VLLTEHLRYTDQALTEYLRCTAPALMDPSTVRPAFPHSTELQLCTVLRAFTVHQVSTALPAFTDLVCTVLLCTDLPLVLLSVQPFMVPAPMAAFTELPAPTEASMEPPPTAAYTELPALFMELLPFMALPAPTEAFTEPRPPTEVLSEAFTELPAHTEAFMELPALFMELLPFMALQALFMEHLPFMELPAPTEAFMELPAPTEAFMELPAPTEAFMELPPPTEVSTEALMAPAPMAVFTAPQDFMVARFWLRLVLALLLKVKH